MLKHPTERELERYLDRSAEAGELLTVDAHLAGCDECRSKVAAHLQMDRISSSFAEILTNDPAVDEHLPYEQMAAYVDGGLDQVAREIADVHAGVCELCAVQLDDLKKLKASLATVPAVTRGTFLERFAGVFSPKWAIPALAVVLLGLAVWLWFPKQNTAVDQALVAPLVDNNMSNDLGSEIAKVPPSNIEPANSANTAAHSLVSLADGGSKIGLDEGGNVTGLKAAQFAPLVKRALAEQDIEISADARKLRSSAGILMGGGGDGVPFKLTSPVGKVLESDRPQFKWQPIDGAQSYVVAVYDADFNRVAVSPPLKQTSWSANVPLRRGSTYKWQVTAIKDSQEIKSPVRPAPDAQFKVIDTASANQIAAAKRQAGNSHLVLGIAYAKAGLIADAEREFQALLKQNPGSEVAKRLLNKVKAAR